MCHAIKPKIFDTAAYEDLRNDPIVSAWLDTICKKSNMEKAYLLGVYKYIEFTDMNTEEFLNEAEIEAAKQKRKGITDICL